jgi:acetolactate synthase I/II/III large subunit
MKVSDVIVDFLIKRNINIVFGIIGSANSHIYNSLINKNIQIINVHNEQAALLAAGAYYKSSGLLAAALVTAGAGASNAITGVVSLWADSTPVLIFSGQESTPYLRDHSNRRMFGTQGFDIVHTVSKTTKYAKTIVEASTIQIELEKCYATTLDNRKGPVWLDIPFDIQSSEVDYTIWNDYTSSIIEAPIEPVIDILQKSKRPIFLAGNGIKLSQSVELFRKVLSKIEIPVLLTWSGIDILENDHPLYFGRPGVYGQRAANFIFQKSDCIIVLGSRLTLPQTGYDFDELARSGKIIMIDVDETEFKSFSKLNIKCDCSFFLKNLNCFYKNNNWIEECLKLKNKFPIIDEFHKDEEFPNSYRIIDKISDYLKDDQIIVTDMGTALLSGHQAIKLKKGNIMFSSYGLGEMGYGLPGALGAAFAPGEKEVLCLNCDGGMMMNIQELQTIIQHQLKIKIIIFNNDGYLMIKHTQKMLFNSNFTAVNNNSGIVLPDYIKVGKAFGYKTFQIKTWDDFNFYFPKFMNENGPSICEIFMPPEQEFIPKVKGIMKTDGSIFAPPIEEMSPLLSFENIKCIMGDNISSKSIEIVRPSQ